MKMMEGGGEKMNRKEVEILGRSSPRIGGCESCHFKWQVYLHVRPSPTLTVIHHFSSAALGLLHKLQEEVVRNHD